MKDKSNSESAGGRGPRVVSAKASAIATATASVSAAVKANLSGRHLSAADYFASQCEAIEMEEATLDWEQPRLYESRHYSIGAVVLAVAALETSVNELYLEAVDRTKSSLDPLSEQQMSLLEELWKGIDRTFTILEKHQVALTACGKPPMDRGAEPAQSAADLIVLRNALIHFKPEWDTELDKHQNLEDRLRQKFPPSALAARGLGTDGMVSESMPRGGVRALGL